MMKRYGRSAGGVSSEKRGSERRGDKAIEREKLTEQRREGFYLDLFGDDKPTASLLARRFAYDRNGVFGACSEPIEGAGSRRSDGTIERVFVLLLVIGGIWTDDDRRWCSGGSVSG